MLSAQIRDQTEGTDTNMIANLFKMLFGFIGETAVGIVTFLGDVFGSLFTLIWDAIKWVGNLIWEAIKWVGNLIWEAIKWIGDLLKLLFQGLIDLLVMFFEVIFDVIKSVLYLLYMIGVLAVKLFLVIFEAAKVLWSLIEGFARTLASLTYTPQASGGNGYSEIMGKLFTNLNVLQLDSIAYVSLFALWFITAITAMKLISSIRVGGE